MTKWALALLLVLVSIQALALDITIDGEVKHQGILSVPDGSRINDVLQQTTVSEDAFFLGAAWYRKAEKAQQERLKYGLLFDLQIMHKSAQLNNQPKLAALAKHLRARIASMPATGRVVHSMDPAALVGTNTNYLLKDSDRLYYPPRPANVTIIGAVENECVIRFTSLQMADHYLRSCKKSEISDRNFIYLIQPDGIIIKEAIALWNSGSKAWIAPGAIILIPIRTSLLDETTINLNQEIAEFLATQPPVASTTQ